MVGEGDRRVVAIRRNCGAAIVIFVKVLILELNAEAFTDGVVQGSPGRQSIPAYNVGDRQQRNGMDARIAGGHVAVPGAREFPGSRSIESFRIIGPEQASAG